MSSLGIMGSSAVEGAYVTSMDGES
jgi:hypothetical protein